MNGISHPSIRLHAADPLLVDSHEGRIAAYTDTTISGHLACRSVLLPGGSLSWVHLILHEPAPLYISSSIAAHFICFGLRGNMEADGFRSIAHHAVRQFVQPGVIAGVHAGEYEFCCISIDEGKETTWRETALLPETITVLEQIRRIPWSAACIPVLNSWVQLLSRLMEATSQMPAGIRATLRHIADNYAEPISVKRLARMAGLNINAYTIRFREATGSTPSAYIQRVRIEAGREMLKDKRLTIDVISASSGFTSRHYFSRVFRHHFGLSPAEFRRNAQKSEKLHLKN